MTSRAPSSYRSYRPTPVATEQRRTPRYACIVLGAWLFASAFLWPHTDPVFRNTWIVGLLITGFSVVTLRATAWRWVNVFLSLWLIITTVLGWATWPATYWNNLLVGALVLICSLAIGYGTGTLTTIERPRPR